MANTQEIFKSTAPLSNIRGTTCKSFILGKKSLSFAENAIVSSTNEDLTRYKTLVVQNDRNKKVIYDMDIPAKSVRYVSEEQNGLTGLHLMDGTVIMIKGSTAGVESNVTTLNPSVPGELVTFADTTGKMLTKSGVTIVRAEDLPAANMTINSAEDIERLIRAYQEDATLNSKIPTMQAVVDYVGRLESILAVRRAGNLENNPLEDDDD